MIASGPPGRRALVVVAHPDDPDFMFGATVAMLTSKGVQVEYVICTDGQVGCLRDDIPSTSLSAIRRSEQQAAAQVLGVHAVTLLGFRDGTLSPDVLLRKEITRHIRRVKPHLVLTHFPRRALRVPIEASHPDHVAVGEATLAAVYPDAGNSRSYPDLPAPTGHHVSEIWLPGYEHPDHWVDATPYLDKKAAAILCHRSQLEPVGAEVVPEWVEHWMRSEGRQQGYAFAESFVRLRLDR